MPSETQNFEREKLYEEIWSEPVSADFGDGDQSFRRT